MPHKRSSSDLVARFDDLQPFTSKSEVDEYFNHERIECLICSRKFSFLSSHLKKHGVLPDVYKAKLALPLSRGLVGTRLRQKMKTIAIESGLSKYVKTGTNARRRSERKSPYNELRKKESGRRLNAMRPLALARMVEVKKERGRHKLLEALRHCSHGMTMTTMAKLSGFPYKTIAQGLSVNRDIRAAFMELTR